jgi:hypothetical protein
MYLGAYLRLEDRFQRERRRDGDMNRILSLVLADLYGDPSPEADDPWDPVWVWDGRTLEGCRVSLRPLSDRLNLNFIRKNLLEKTRLAALLRPGKTAEELQQFREDRGLSLIPGAYRDFFAEEILERYFSVYGWANISLTDEFALRKLALSLTGSEYAAEYVRRAAQTLIIQRQGAETAPLPGGGDLRDILGVYYEELFPFINAEPLMNVNHLEPAILWELIAYPAYGIHSPERRYEELLARRERGGLTGQDIRNILGLSPDNPLNQYLGCITWFWEITVAGQGRSCRTVLCRLPGTDPGESPGSGRFRIIERRME